MASKESRQEQAGDPLSALLAKALDDCIRIPGTRFRFGLDPIIGLIPGVGDGTASAAGMAIVVQGVRSGLPRIALVRMLVNILINALFGAVPVIGDVFSAWFKSNRRNYKILEAHEKGTRSSTAMDWILVGAFVLLLIAVIIGVAAVSIWILTSLFNYLASLGEPGSS